MAMFMPVHLAPCIRTVPEHPKRIYACKLARLDARGLARAEVYNGNKTCTRGKYCVYNMYLKVPVRTTTVGTRKWGRASGDAGGRGCLDAYCGSGGDKWAGGFTDSGDDCCFPDEGSSGDGYGADDFVQYSRL
jgi:hypothetical protein